MLKTDIISGCFASARDITLKDGMLAKSARTGLSYIKSIDPDRLLAPCFEAHNLNTPGGKLRYGGWERKGANNWTAGGGDETYTLAGHSLGHWMSAAAAFCTELRDKETIDMLSYTVSKLDELQNRTGSGYIGGVNENVFIYMFNSNPDWCKGYWVPWYGVHKIYKGLIDAYCLADIKTALKVAKKFCDWAFDGLSKLSYDFIQEALKCEYGGMNEIFAQMYELTGYDRYLKAARWFTQDSVIEPLAEGVDCLSGKHANTTIPKLLGAAALYEQSPKKYIRYKKAVKNFWDFVTDNRSYVIGGNSIAEHFEAEGAETPGIKTCESCNTYNMLRLSKYLFAWTMQNKYIDFYENAMYNHLLGQQEPDTGAKMYFTSLLQGHHRIYEVKNESWWCCTGTGMENPALYTDAAYYKHRDTLYINLYFPNTFIWREKNLTLSLETDYPYSDEVKLTVTDGEADADIALRAPSWICSPLRAIVNNRDEYTADGGKHLTISRSWKKGDEIIIKIPSSINIYHSREKGKVAFRYGFVTLAAELAKVKDAPGVAEYITNETVLDSVVCPVPYLVKCEKQLEDIVETIDRKRLLFRIKGKYTSSGEDIYLKPFYEIHHHFHNVYWDEDKPADEYEKLLNRITIDALEPDGQQDEIGHMLTSLNSHQGSFTKGTKIHYWRDAYGDGDAFFQYTLNVNDKARYLFVRYWGPDTGFAGMNRDFNIFIDDMLVATQQLNNLADDTYDVFYAMPDINGKKSITVKFAAKDKLSCAGGVLELRVTSEKIT